MQKLKPGNRVRHIKTNQIGIVASVKNSTIVVSVGSMLLSCKPSDLAILPNQTSTKNNNFDTIRTGKKKIDLHGLTVKEAEVQLLDAINDAVLHKIAILEVIHGKGSGKLRSLLESLISSAGINCRLVQDLANYGHSFIYFCFLMLITRSQ